jgi:hypothetical protein
LSKSGVGTGEFPACSKDAGIQNKSAAGRFRKSAHQVSQSFFRCLLSGDITAILNATPNKGM